MPPSHLSSACDVSSYRVDVVGGRRDPFIWQSRRGFHMLMHDHAPFAFHKQVLTYAFTDDTTARNGWRFSYVQVTRSIIAPIRAPLSERFQR